MNETVSRLIFGVSVFVFVVGLALTFFWFSILISADGWAGFGFIVIAPWFIGGSLLLAVIPSAVVYFCSRERRDFRSLGLSASGCFFVALEFFATFWAPLHAS